MTISTSRAATTGEISAAAPATAPAAAPAAAE